ncbi:MAG: hypothetical protein HC913_13900 [Microscillaceae bacterium]|nr:hypothetical protein [Microscillaceae bacterium]
MIYPSILTCFIFAGLIFSLAGCGDLEQSIKNREAIADELKSRKVKFVTEAQLSAWAIREGENITRRAQKLLNRAFLAQTEKGKDFSPKDFAQLDLSLDTLTTPEYLKQIDKLGFDKIPPSLRLEKSEEKIWQGYARGETNLQSYAETLPGDSLVFFVSPIILAGRPVGMWRLRFDKPGLVRSFDLKKLNPGS